MYTAVSNFKFFKRLPVQAHHKRPQSVLAHSTEKCFECLIVIPQGNILGPVIFTTLLMIYLSQASVYQVPAKYLLMILY